MQPALALTTADTGGVAYVTWYEEVASGVVRRYGQGLSASHNGNGSYFWNTLTAPFALEQRTYAPFPLADNASRGVFEYQGAGHVPGANGGLGAWVEVHAATLQSVPSGTDHRLFSAQWR